MDSTVVTTNWAEVADKALDMSQSAVMGLSEAIQDIAPKAWEIAMRQVYAEVLYPIIILFLFAVVVGVVTYLYDKKWKPIRKREGEYGTTDEWDTYIILGRWVPGIALTGITTGLVFAVANLVMILINPEYYGIKKVLELAGM